MPKGDSTKSGHLNPAFKHGLSTHPAYGTWYQMNRRCYDESHKHYGQYGGRGIFVTHEWRIGPESFINWIDGTHWEQGKHEIDRIDNDGPYAPWNVRIVDRSENMQNTRRAVRLSIDGHQMSAVEASKKFGIPARVIRERLKSGWSDIDAIKPIGATVKRGKTYRIYGAEYTISEAAKAFNLSRDVVKSRAARGDRGADLVRAVK